MQKNVTTLDAKLTVKLKAKDPRDSIPECKDAIETLKQNVAVRVGFI